MFIQSDSILTALTKKAQSYAQDRSRHLLCPSCRTRTKLYSLKDGRRKCSACGEKFNPEKKTDAARLKQCADILLCFCINFTAKQASALSGYHYKLVATLYDDFRLLLAQQNLPLTCVEQLTTAEAYDHSLQDGKQHAAPVFGLKILPGKNIFIDPLFKGGASTLENTQKYAEYAGFICRGTFQRFSGNERRKDGAEQTWAWIHERLKRHHGIWKHHIGLYLKELEWKYNSRSLTSEEQAMKIVELMPGNFLTAWRKKKETRDVSGKQNDTEN